MKELNKIHHVDIIPTFLVHATPPEFINTEEYVDFVINNMLPKIQGMAEYSDIFCENGVFDPEQSRRVLTAAKELGFKLKIHAKQAIWITFPEMVLMQWQIAIQ